MGSDVKYLVAVVAILLVVQVKGQQNTVNEHNEWRYLTCRAEEDIVLDGKLTEVSWQNAEILTDFWMSFPVDDKKADSALKTKVKITYNEQFIFIGAECYGDDNYIIQTLKRDNKEQNEDVFGVVIDPVNERTNGFTFIVNPLGVQKEMLITGQTGRREILEAGRTPQGVNLAWDNKWFSEVSNYPDKWVVEIAIPFKSLRYDESKPAWGVNFFRVDAKSNSIHTWSKVPIEFNELDLGYTGELIWDNPPKKTKGNISVIPYVLGGVYRDFEAGEPNDFDFQGGVDSKIALTSGLNFDLTVNPDFSQVEVDEQVTNLTLFDIRLPEKRLFFLENSDIFEDFGIPPMRPFFSRRIGLDEDGNSIPILFGARLSGNVNKDLRIGLMNMQTREKNDFQAQNYTAAAFHKQVLSRSVIKGYVHNRQATNSDTSNYNRNIGLEFLYRSVDGRFQGFLGYSKSFNPGVKSKNYFFNSGIGYDNRSVSVYSNFAGVGDNYVADMGYFRGQEYYDAVRDTSIRIGMTHWYTRGSYTFYPGSSKKIISHTPGFRIIRDLKSDLSTISVETELSYSIRFTNTSNLTAAYSMNHVNLLYPYSFTDEVPLPAENYKYQFGEITWFSDMRRRLSFNAGASYGGFYNGTRYRYLLGMKYRAQPWGNFSFMFEQNTLDFPAPYGKVELLLITPRIDVNFSKELFWTTFIQYDTQGDNFNINSRLQWRFQPMSDIYLVYTDNYSVDKRIPKNRALVLKVNYWLNL
ncbi:hypothetical protein GM418_14945 [Maribellus comscasis]|uniref:DUF5916 domain-containing protein n=1 Tax=Maribellus comscasis TaxID=2681766 RepID=A0A6I6JV27_9BACT|nr:carbohydrate binding family 9 domain-containing protein [Maribellus comscasis]QGY44918.1 hypothetical protein GM418_14945 [Maribellus comscasis]